MRGMSAVLHHIPSTGIVHHDASCRNIVMDSDGRMVLADLGLAEQQQLPSLNKYTSVVDQSKTAVPVRWTSPESLQTQQYGTRSDVWSLGMALWECTAGGGLQYREQCSTKACKQPIIAGQMKLHMDDAWGNAASVSVAKQQLAVRVRRLIQLCLMHNVQQRSDSEQLVELAERERESGRSGRLKSARQRRLCSANGWCITRRCSVGCGRVLSAAVRLVVSDK